MKPEFVRRMSTMWKGIHSSWMAGVGKVQLGSCRLHQEF